MSPARLRRVLARRPAGDDGVAILMSLAFIGIFTTLMLVMLSVVLGQVKPTAQARKDVGSLNAASSGLQAGLTRIRSSVDVSGDGNFGRLPCDAGTPATFRTGADVQQAPGASLTGAASAIPGSFTYRVDVAYFQFDPTDKSPTWLKANALACPLTTTTPGYAYLQSYGTGANIAGAGGNLGTRGNRAQTGVYKFSVPLTNLAGGRLKQQGTNLCLDAGANPIGAGRTLTFQTCQPTGASPAQQFEYRSDLTLYYDGDPSKNLCISGATTDPSLQRCVGTGDGPTYPYGTGQQVQEWSYNNFGHFATAADNGGLTGKCLQPLDASTGASVTVSDCVADTGDYRGFNPDPSVGAGKAGGNISGIPGSPTNQYVNFAQFGRCLDINGAKVNSYMIAYPCKQAPDSTTLQFNQVFTWVPLPGGTGSMVTHTPADTDQGGVRDADYCLTAPASGALVTVTQCTRTAPSPAQTWTATGSVPASPETSYALVSALLNKCMAVTDASNTIALQPCDGSPQQRWNAPPPVPDAGLNNIKEGTTAR